MVGRNFCVLLDEEKLPGAEVLGRALRRYWSQATVSSEASLPRNEPRAYRPRRTASLKNRAGKNGDHV